MRSVATGFLIFLFWTFAAEARAGECEIYTAERPDAPADLAALFATDGEPAGLPIAEDAAAGRYFFMFDPRPHERWEISLVLERGHFRMAKTMLATYHEE